MALSKGLFSYTTREPRKTIHHARTAEADSVTRTQMQELVDRGAAVWVGKNAIVTTQPCPDLLRYSDPKGRPNPVVVPGKPVVFRLRPDLD